MNIPNTSAATLMAGTVIPAHPLALDSHRHLDERRQRALTRYYVAAGVGGLAIGVHTTQFAIHDPAVGLLRPVWELGAEEMDRADRTRSVSLVRVAGICGNTRQAVSEAGLARELGYQYGLLNLGALRGATIDSLLDHCRAVAEVIDLFGFYLQPKVGGLELPLNFWRRFCEIPQLRAIKVAAFDRYRTWDVVRGLAETGRSDVALYTGNDDTIVWDLVTPYSLRAADTSVDYRFVGGLLGQWAVWTAKAVKLHRDCRALAQRELPVPAEITRVACALTRANGAIFDAAHDFRGCIPGILEVLRRQRILCGTWCLDEHETLSAGQGAEIERVCQEYPELTDDPFVAAHLDDWLR